MKHKRIECISDYCGDKYNCGFSADICENEDGSRFVELCEGWKFYAENSPKIIKDTDKHYNLFIEACKNHNELDYACEHWKN